MRLGRPPSKPIIVVVEIIGQLISLETWQKYLPQIKLNSSAVVLQTYTAETMAVLGVMMV